VRKENSSSSSSFARSNLQLVCAGGEVGDVDVDDDVAFLDASVFANGR